MIAPPDAAAFGRLCADTALAEIAEARAAERRRALQRNDLAEYDRTFLTAEEARLTALAKRLRETAMESKA